MFSVLRTPKVGRVWSGQLVSMLGDGVYTVTVSLYLLPRADAAQALGSLLAATALGSIATLVVGGAVADRVRRSLVICAADLLRILGVVALLLAGQDAHIGVLVVLGVVFGCGAGIHRPAYTALIAQLAGREKRRETSALRSATSRFTGIVGPVVGGAVAAASSPRWGLLINILTFVFSLATLARLDEPHVRGDEDKKEEKAGILREAQDGLRYVRRRKWMLGVMLQGTAQAALVIAPMAVILPLVMGGRGPAALGLVTSATACGALAASLTASRIRARQPGAVAMLALMCELPQIVAVAVDAPTVLVVAFSALTGAGASVFAVLWGAALQERTPDAMLGRVYALDALLTQALMPLCMAAAGLLLAVLSTSAIAVVAACALPVTVVAVLRIPGVMTLGGTTEDRGTGEAVSAKPAGLA
ncbi:MFS transporter [Streptomyces castrisilvae]|uniref:MFS transporter n=1 Tax=Streptomyces castrisilvae TaxID=3033811 RepID=A0ABY9HG67_9ACTN|nr:MFS transporter [Streptomyces sp. Mut1]WLQ33194.1 MFS transporter [Streptomyces sp. Mut1]